MATITVNIPESIEQRFRIKVYQLYGKRKGMIGRAVGEAMIEWSKKKEYIDKCMNLLENGVDMGKLKYSNREELHDRN